MPLVNFHSTLLVFNLIVLGGRTDKIVLYGLKLDMSISIDG